MKTTQKCIGRQIIPRSEQVSVWTHACYIFKVQSMGYVQEFGCRSAGEHPICGFEGAVVFCTVQFFKLAVEI